MKMTMFNMDFNLRALVRTPEAEWLPSPMPGVWRKPLAREEAEGGHATSIVRYDEGSSFSAHEHPGGEEILVLEGVFSDRYGDFGPGSYFRNPPGSSHAPASKEGCLLLVKLHQFRPGDTEHVCVDTTEATWEETADCRVLPLHAFESERVRLEEWPAGSTISTAGGKEFYVQHTIMLCHLHHRPCYEVSRRDHWWARENGKD